jgi:hypothetical protein
LKPLQAFRAEAWDALTASAVVAQGDCFVNMQAGPRRASSRVPVALKVNVRSWREARSTIQRAAALARFLSRKRGKMQSRRVDNVAEHWPAQLKLRGRLGRVVPSLV